MTTEEVIAGTCKGEKFSMKVTRSEPETVTVVDETVKPEPFGKVPEDAGKRTIEVLPGIKLVAYTKGYMTLKVKGKGWNNKKVEVGKPLYREEVQVVIDALLAEIEGLKSYEEANGTVPF